MQYFTTLFASTEREAEEVVAAISSSVGEIQNQILRTIHLDKSPGLDGMNSAFYKKK